MKLVLSLSDDLARALAELAAWETSPELEIAATLVRLALERRSPLHDLRFQWATLTGREREIACWLARGDSISRAASRMVITRDTAKVHLRNLRIKLGQPHMRELRQTLLSLPRDWLLEELSPGGERITPALPPQL